MSSYRGRSSIIEVSRRRHHALPLHLFVGAICIRRTPYGQARLASPVRAPRDFPPPPAIYNPWDEMSGPSMMFGASQDDDDIEEDFGGAQGSDEDEGIRAANTLSDDGHGEDDDE